MALTNIAVNQFEKVDSNPAATRRIVFPVRNYNLEATLTSGQTFRWRRGARGWEGVVGRYWVRLSTTEAGLQAESSATAHDWDWLRHYLQLDLDLETVLATFPNDAPLLEAVQACYGLRILRQEPWECLASFILSSSKQIVQIEQIVNRLCQRFGEPVAGDAGTAAVYAFPPAERLANCGEAELRACKMGFRAPYLLHTARVLTEKPIDWPALWASGVETARTTLMELPGVGRKIADCVLLFAGGLPGAFPIDVWVEKALRQLYFPRRPVSRRRLEAFAATHFGPQAGYAQQYLFHYMRTWKNGKG